MASVISPRSRTVALILAGLFFFCGVGGMHRLYTGKIFTGILQLITFGGLVVWQLVDVIRILLGMYSDAQGRDITEW